MKISAVLIVRTSTRSLILNIARNLLFLLIPSLVLANQIKEVGHKTLWLSSDAQTIVGGTVSSTQAIDLKIKGVDGSYIMPNRGWVWVSGSGSICEDDSITVYVSGSYINNTVNYIDTVIVRVDTSNSGVGEFSFTLDQGDGLVDKIVLGFEPESASADDSCSIYTRAVFEYTQDINYSLDLTDYQLDSDTTSWDFTATDGGAKADSGDVGYLAQDEAITGNWDNTANPWANDEVDVSDNFAWTGNQTFSGRFILPLHTIAAGDSVLGHTINDAADTTIKCWSGSAWVTIQDLIP